MDVVVVEPGDGADMTIDELARAAKIPASTVRLYQSRGLLEPPERRGRVGYYGVRHRSRLRTIARLQEEGFSLAAIKVVIDAQAAGRSLDDLIGATDGKDLLAPARFRLSPLQLAQRFDGGELGRDELVRAVDMGLVTIDGTDLVISNPMFAELGPALAADGVALGDVLDAFDELCTAAPAVVDAFRAATAARQDGCPVHRGSSAEGATRVSAAVDVLAVALLIGELQTSFRDIVRNAALGAPPEAGDRPGDVSIGRSGSGLGRSDEALR